MSLSSGRHGRTGGQKTLEFNCPWAGHHLDPNFVLRNTAAPNVIGHRCLKCKCLIYEYLELSQIVGADGAPLPAA